MTDDRPSATKPGIAITGIGVILPKSVTTVDEFWQQLRDGRSQIDFLSRFDTTDMVVKVAGEISHFDHGPFLPALSERYASKYSRDILMLMAAVEQCRHDAKLERGDIDPQRLGLITSSSRGPLEWWCEALQQEARGEKPYSLIQGLPGNGTSMAAIYSGIQGFVTTLSNACVGGQQAVHLAMCELQSDKCDAVFVGASEFPVIKSLFNTYMHYDLMAKEGVTPASTMKPYDVNRDGFALGEGAIVLCLEPAARARRRGARIYAEVLAEVSISEASHPTHMDLSGHMTAGVIQKSLNEANRSVGDIHYVCGHGTATRYNDMAESRALGKLYGNKPRSRWAPHGSIKPIFGHLLGGSGVLNTAACALMIHHGYLCPTINLTTPDPECDHDHVAEGARQTKVETVVSLAFGLGSQTSAMVLSAPQ